MTQDDDPHPPETADIDAAIRNAYAQLGVTEYYAQHGATYRNPHEAQVRAVLSAALPTWGLDLAHVLDLACGSGEATRVLYDLGAEAVQGIDPYTGAAYTTRTGQTAERLRFEDIAAGVLSGRAYSLIVCSFALHLVAASRLPALCWRLAEVAPALVVVTPHKKPELRAAWGWHLHAEQLTQRVRARCYYRAQ